MHPTQVTTKWRSYDVNRQHEMKVPTECEEIHKQLEILQWAQVKLKVIPNLPKGTLRSKVEESLHSLIDGDETSKEALTPITTDVRPIITKLRAKLEYYGYQKSPSPQQLLGIKEIISETLEGLDRVMSDHTL
jgi:hypothetical protein